jgi:tetrahydromethanopterin S-methyltransferase subunit C
MKGVSAQPKIGAAGRRSLARPAFGLALLSMPGSTIAWWLPGGGFVFGFPPAIAAVVLGVQALRRGEPGRGKALTAIAIASVMLTLMAVWLIVETI